VTGAVSGSGGLCLELAGGGTVNGTNVQVATCSGNPGQVWQPQPNNSIKNPVSGRCLDVAGGGTANGTNVQLWDCNGGVAQVWGWRPDGSLINPASGRCLDVAGAGTTTGTNVQIWDCNGFWSQHWMPQANGSLVDSQSTRCADLEAAGTANGTRVINWTCTGEANQLWQYQPNSTLKAPLSGRCMDITGGGTANGTLVRLWDCTGTAAQTWQPQADGSLRNPASGRCLDTGSTPSPAASLMIWDCTGSLSQKWTHNLIDADGLAGVLRESSSLDGATVVASTIHEPTVTQTAVRSAPVVGGTDVIARIVRETSTRARTWVAATTSWRWTQTATSYDSYGLPTDVTDAGDLAVTTDDVCSHTDYARNTTTYLINFPSQTVTTDCSPSPGAVNHLAGSQVLYDGSTVLGAAPTQGLPTKSLALASFNVATPVWKPASRTGYDGNGRPTAVFDAIDRQTTTAYTPATGGPVTQIAVTNPMGWTTTTTVDPGRSVPTTVVDVNTKTTTGQYDPLGRLAKVWLARPSTAVPDLEYGYTLQGSGPNVVTTNRLGPGGNQITSTSLLDGRLRPRQAQTPAPQANGGRMVTDVAYDGRGLAVKESVFWNNTALPGSTLVAFADAAVANQHRRSYDNLERVTADQLWSLNVLKW
jgi:hypothetical protein